MEAEIDVFTSFVLSVMFYLAVRCFIKQKLVPENWVKLETVNSMEETLRAHRSVLDIWVNQAVPFAVAIWQIY